MSVPSRRRFLAAAAAGAAALPFSSALGQSAPPMGPFETLPDEVPPPPAAAPPPDVAGDARVGGPLGSVPGRPLPVVATPVKPRRLRQGSTIGLVSPAGASYADSAVRAAEIELRRLGYQTRRGAYVLERHGYLGGTDQQRAADVMRMFEDPSIDAIMALRGGWGCARLLPYLDFDVIRRHPKIVCGFSDITGLLTALYAQTGLVTFHGPVATSTWNDFTTGHFRRTVEFGDRVTMAPTAATEVDTLTPGVATGRLVGGNLSVLAALVGTGYVPDMRGHLLFLEEVSEEPYRIDRMLTQLVLAGFFDQVGGVVFGNCRDCGAAAGDVSLSLRRILEDHLHPRGIPVFYGTMIGHITDKFTVPIGVEAEMDARAGTIRLLEPAVV